jgi:pimeloyl-ACP methyl ester carboxylesterase
MVFSFLVSASARADKTICDERYQTFGDVSKEVKMKELENADVDETWYVPGWMRTNKPEELAWSSFTNVFSTTKNRFRRWDGNQLWPIAVKNADAEAVKLADEIKAMPEERRAHLTLVGHSLGGRIVARALSKVSSDGIKIKRGILLAPAIPANDGDIERMGFGSEEPIIVVVNPDDMTLKYVYAIAGGEAGPAYGASAASGMPRNVKEIPVNDDIAKSTVIDAFWGRFDAVKEIANHHALFYLEELSQVLDGKESKGVRVMVPQDKVNFEWKVMDAGVWWNVLDEKAGWKLERNIVTGHCRIINPEKIRVAWGDYSRMKMAFNKVVAQLVLPAAKHSAEH